MKRNTKTESPALLTMRNTAPNKVAFILTSRSVGKEMPKLSVSVNTSFAKPLHCLLILPTCTSPSADRTCLRRGIVKENNQEYRDTCRQHGKQQEVQARGRLRWITSFWEVSRIFMSKGRRGPQQFLVQQSVSSAAK
ncbi:hypothetical protein E2C01_031802 [Portunus trituberculatus]|uniref:Uncharacterized protein n=1 Tax=Portunus trituberculatus TaxID=210409 RepID=A0A5B7EYT7_PORTR|nr:hypothetical protein [Portunus trituberculatus]